MKTSSMRSFISQSRETATRGLSSTSPAASAARGQSRSANGKKRTTKCHTPALGRGAGPDICNAPARPGYAPAAPAGSMLRGRRLGGRRIRGPVFLDFLRLESRESSNLHGNLPFSSLRHDKTQEPSFILGYLPVSHKREGNLDLEKFQFASGKN